MPFIGNTPDVNFTSFAKQDITGNGGANYTLTHAVANANEIEVYVNNVRQEPTDAYSVSGTALSMTGNVASSDNFYVIFLGKAIQTTVPPDGSVSTAKIANSAVDLTSKVTGVLPVANGGTGATSYFTGVSNLQFFRLDGNVTSTTTPTVLTSWADGHDNELFKRIGTAWSNSSGVFTPSVNGLYEVIFIASLSTTSNNDYVQIDFQPSTDSGSNYTNEDLYTSAVHVNSGSTHHHHNFIRYYNIATASTFRFRVKISAEGTNVMFRGSGGVNRKCALVFKRIADAQ